MPGPRDYGVGTERALYLLSRGTCYYPDCSEPVLRFVEDKPISNMRFTHIHGANPGSARYDPAMRDTERAAFTNLVLMCKPHHDLIDRIDPGRFSASLLHQWKKKREGDGASALNGLNGLTEARLSELLESSFRANAPQREVTIELSGAIFYDDGLNAISVAPAAWRNTLDINPHLPITRQAILTTARNIGSIPSSVEGFSIDFVFNDAGGQQQVCTLSGQDSFPALNPLLPKSLNVGAPAIRWLTSFDSLRAFLSVLAAHGEIGIRATASLGSGGTVMTDICPISLIPLDR